MTQRDLLAIFAHPDDEAYRPGGTLALLAHRKILPRFGIVISTEALNQDVPRRHKRARLDDFTIWVYICQSHIDELFSRSFDMCKGHHDEHDGAGRCCSPGSRVRGFIQPRLLLLLLQKPSHGYGLMDRLSQDEEMPGADPGLLYRTLRQLEEDGLVRSSWDTEGKGPARRLYQVTPEGVEYLHTWAINIRRTRERLDRFLAEYETYFQQKKRGEKHVRTR